MERFMADDSDMIGNLYANSWGLSAAAYQLPSQQPDRPSPELMSPPPTPPPPEKRHERSYDRQHPGVGRMPKVRLDDQRRQRRKNGVVKGRCTRTRRARRDETIPSL